MTIRIRAARDEDAAQIAAIYMPYVTGSAISFETKPPSEAEMRERMHGDDGLYPWLVATTEDDEAVLGYAYAGRFRDRPAYRYTVETSIYLGGGVQGQGVGRLLYSALMETLIAQDFTQAVAILSLPNEHSIGLHEATGFRRAGIVREIGFKAGQWHDIGMWQRELSEPANPPSDPKPFSEVGMVGPK
jgi:L-amino acid N-acyltransferase YncA